MKTEACLWVDDDRRPPSADWTWVKTAEEAIEHLSQYRVDVLSLDYSLGYMRGNTQPVVEWMKENYFPATVHVHSGHPGGREWLIEQITEHAPGVLGDTTPATNSGLFHDLI